MKATEFINEIERIPAGAYRGGKSYLSPGGSDKAFKKLPGGSGLLYTIEDLRNNPYIKLWDPNSNIPDPKPVKDRYEFSSEFALRMKQWEKRRASGKKIPQIIGKLTLEPAYGFPLTGALQVGTITVDEDYRGAGIAKAMYGIVLTILKRPLLAGGSQTPGGRRNWVSLSEIPGVEMKGYAVVDEGLLNPNSDYIPARQSAEQRIDIIMGKLGGQYIGKDRRDQHYFAFDVQPTTSGKELEAHVKQNLARVYNEGYRIGTGLYAVWTGQ
jgi:hypothetical protein